MYTIIPSLFLFLLWFKLLLVMFQLVTVVSWAGNSAPLGWVGLEGYGDV